MNCATVFLLAFPPYAFAQDFIPKFVYIPPGEFDMGSPENEKDRFLNETPQHRVRISQGFEMQTTEVTQLQYYLITGSNPSRFKDCEKYGPKQEPICPNHPVDMVSWADAQAFIQRLNELQDKCVYRLPTEAEWEYAARGGEPTIYSFGSDASGLGAHAWYYDNSNGRSQMVASKMPNPFGLYDMHGNVWEWVQDWYGDYPKQSITDPKGPSSGSRRVVRGGSWSNLARYLRSAPRNSYGPGDRNDYLGFRLVRSCR